MIRIRRIYSSALPSDRENIAQVKEIFRASFGAVGFFRGVSRGLEARDRERLRT